MNILRAVISCLLISGACIFSAPSFAPADGQSTVAFMSDGHVQPTQSGVSLITADLNRVDDNLLPGWALTCVVTCGDITDISTPEGYNFDGAYAASDLRSLPLFFGVGNHEISDGALDMPAVRSKYAGYPDWNKRPGPANCAETTYSFDAGDIHVAVINEYFNGSCDSCCDGDVVDGLFNWLKADLRSSTKPCKVVCAHEPAYPRDNHLGDSLDQFPDHRNRFWNLLQAERVAAFITGHTHQRKMADYDGVYEITGGPFGAQAPATFSYVHYDGSGYTILQASESDSAQGWNSPMTAAVTEADLGCRMPVTTGEGAGTRATYFIDYTAADQSPDPDWSGNNGGRWWEPPFDDAAAGWSDGELSAGYDSGEEGPWPWMNTPVEPRNGIYGIFERIRFTSSRKEEYAALSLETDYDDAVIVWLNGTRIFSSDNAPSIGEGDFWNKLASDCHDASGEHAHAPSLSATDVTAYKNALLDGENLLAVGCWNCALGSHDLAAGVRLSLRYHFPLRVSFQPAVSAIPFGFCPAGPELYGAAYYSHGWRE